MSNVKKCLIFKNLKNHNRDCFSVKRPAFLLLEFVVTLGITVVSITMLGSLLYSVAQTRQATMRMAQLVDGMTGSVNNREVDVDRVAHEHQAELIFDGAAHVAWRQRWKGRSLLPVEPIRLGVSEVGLRGGKTPMSVRCMGELV